MCIEIKDVLSRNSTTGRAWQQIRAKFPNTSKQDYFSLTQSVLLRDTTSAPLVCPWPWNVSCLFLLITSMYLCLSAVYLALKSIYISTLQNFIISSLRPSNGPSRSRLSHLCSGFWTFFLALPCMPHGGSSQGSNILPIPEMGTLAGTAWLRELRRATAVKYVASPRTACSRHILTFLVHPILISLCPFTRIRSICP